MIPNDVSIDSNRIVSYRGFYYTVEKFPTGEFAVNIFNGKRNLLMVKRVPDRIILGVASFGIARMRVHQFACQQIDGLVDQAKESQAKECTEDGVGFKCGAYYSTENRDGLCNSPMTCQEIRDHFDRGVKAENISAIHELAKDEHKKNCEAIDVTEIVALKTWLTVLENRLAIAEKKISTLESIC